MAEFAWRRTKNERNYSLLSIEEPEAHLHPQLQRAVFEKLFNSTPPAQALLITSHSPTLAATAPLRSIVHLKSAHGSTRAFSLARLPITADELEDIERYITSTRAELLFARGVIFVEGDAEQTLFPVFANAIGVNLDELGITVCNMAGVHFDSYVKLAGSLGLPFAVVTDWDPIDATKPPLGKARTLDLWDAYASVSGRAMLTLADRSRWNAADFATFSAGWAKAGIFLNSQTFEVAMAAEPTLLAVLLDVLDEQNFGSVRKKRIANWRSGTPVDAAQLLAMVADVGKGRLSARLARKALLSSIKPPAYIAAAIDHVARLV